jgi:hypothetical protein
METHVAAVGIADASGLVQGPVVARPPVSALARTRPVIGHGRKRDSERRQP